MMEFSDEVLVRIARWNKIESLGNLAQTCKKWHSISKDETEWKNKIFSELTKQPKLKVGGSYKDYYKNIYNSRSSSSYRNYLTRPIEIFVEGDEHSYTENYYTLENYLIEACSIGAEIWANKLIELGVNLDMPTSRYDTITCGEDALKEATRKGHLHIIDLLITRGVNINFFARICEETVFHEALNSPIPEECLKKLLNPQNYEKVTVLPAQHKAIILNDLALVKQLFDDQIDFNELDSYRVSPLGWAIMLGRTECVKMLLKKRVSLKNVAPSHYAEGLGLGSALRLTIAKKQAFLLKLILENGGNPNESWVQNQSISKRGHLKSKYSTPIEFVVSKNFPEGLKLLIQYGATDGFDEALDTAAICDYLDCLRILINQSDALNDQKSARRKNYNYKQSNIDIDGILSTTARYGSTDSLHFLLNMEANSNLNTSRKPSESGKNLALHAAAAHLAGLKGMTNCYYLSSHLDQHDSYDDCPDEFSKARFEFGQTNYDPLDTKNIFSYQAILSLKLLLKHGSEVNFTINEKHSALSILVLGIAKKNDIISINTNKIIMCAIELLFEYGVDDNIAIEIFDETINEIVDSSPLHYALKLENLNLVKLFIEKGSIEINDKDADGNTPLQIASEIGNKEIIQYLSEKEIETSISHKLKF